MVGNAVDRNTILKHSCDNLENSLTIILTKPPPSYSAAALTYCLATAGWLTLLTRHEISCLAFRAGQRCGEAQRRLPIHLLKSWQRAEGTGSCWHSSRDGAWCLFCACCTHTCRCCPACNMCMPVRGVNAETCLHQSAKKQHLAMASLVTWS